MTWGLDLICKDVDSWTQDKCVRQPTRPSKSRRPAFQRAFEGEKAHGHCAVGLELFPRPQSSGVQESSQAGKAHFACPASLSNSVTYRQSPKSLQKFSTARVTYD